MKDDKNQNTDAQNNQNVNEPSEEHIDLEADLASDLHTDNQNDSNDQTDDIEIEEDETASGLTPQDKIKKLRTQLKTALDDKQNYLTGWQREKAEFINARKRDEESKQDFIKFAESSLIEELIPVLDSCREALKAGEAGNGSGTGGTNDAWIKGIKSMYDKLLGVCQKRGLEEYGAVGDVFDPNIHQSVSSMQTNDKKLDETVANVLQKGYRMRGKIIRPALVAIYQV